MLDRVGSLVPDQQTASQALSVALKAIRKGKANDQTAPNFISHLTDDKPAKRVLIIAPELTGVLQRPTKNDKFYPRANSTIAQIARQLEGHATVRVFYAIRNPATFLPTCWTVALSFQPEMPLETFLTASNPHNLRWSELLHRIQGNEDEGVPLTVWDWEGYLRNWRMVAQAFGALENKEELVDCGAQLPAEISLKGASLMHAYLQEHPAKDEDTFDKVRTRFEEKFPLEGLHTLPEIWPEDLVGELTDAYDDDLYYIERMEGLTFVKAPEYQ